MVVALVPEALSSNADFCITALADSRNSSRLTPPGPKDAQRLASAASVSVAKAAAGASALDVYAIARRLAKRKDGAELVPHVKDMQRKLKRGRRKATSEPAPDQSVNPAPKP